MDLSVAFHGAVGRTTGSAHIIQAGNKRILLDCGMIQGIPHHYNRKFSFDPKSIDHLVLSHAHIDHSARIPLLYLQGYEGPVYCTPATKDLLKILLLDAVKISKIEARKASRRKQKGKTCYHCSLSSNQNNREKHLIQVSRRRSYFGFCTTSFGFRWN